MSDQHSQAADGLLRLPDVITKTGLSRSEIYRRMAQDRFPKCRKLSPRVAVWSRREVLEFTTAPFLDNESRELL